MTKDPVVEEVRARGRTLTQRYGNDPGAMMKLLREEARDHPQVIVDTISIVGSGDVGDSVAGKA
jgi:hypothetical protein